MTQSHSRGDQERKEGGAADCTGGVADTEGVGGIEAVENAVFGVQSMEVDVVEETVRAFASRYGMSDRRFMIGGRIGVLLLNSSM